MMNKWDEFTFLYGCIVGFLVYLGAEKCLQPLFCYAAFRGEQIVDCQSHFSMVTADNSFLTTGTPYGGDQLLWSYGNPSASSSDLELRVEDSAAGLQGCLPGCSCCLGFQKQQFAGDNLAASTKRIPKEMGVLSEQTLLLGCIGGKANHPFCFSLFQ